MVAVGTAEGYVLKLISESHAIVGMALGADEGKPIVGTIPDQVLYHLGGGGGRRRREEEEGERERERGREREEEEGEGERGRERKIKSSFWLRGTTEHYHDPSETASGCLGGADLI